MKKDSFKLIIMSVAVICIVIAGIMVPEGTKLLIAEHLPI